MITSPIFSQMTCILRWAVACLTVGWAGTVASAEPTLITLMSGGKTGVYYPVGGAICRLINAGRGEHGIRCITKKSQGSVENLKAVRGSSATLAIAQSDWHRHALDGTSVFKETGPDRDLRSVFALFPEPFTVVAHPDAAIARLDDLKGKRVSVGAAGSGGRATMDLVLAALGWSVTQFAVTTELETGALPRALCAGEIDAAAFAIAHPNLVVEEMVTSCDAVLVPIDGPAVERLVGAQPSYFRLDIPAETYPGQAASVPVFALGATLVASSRMPSRVVYQLAKAVFESFDAFRDSHPALASLEKARMLTDGLSAPLHLGALRYYSVAGLR